MLCFLSKTSDGTTTFKIQIVSSNFLLSLTCTLNILANLLEYFLEQLHQLVEVYSIAKELKAEGPSM